MGLFGNNYNKIERGLLEHYSHMFTMMGMPNAQKTAREMLDKAIKESKADYSYYLPSNFGSIILKEEQGDEKQEQLAEIIRKSVDKKRVEGVKDTDIRWWWNLNEIERRMMLAVDDIARMALFIKSVQEDGLSDKQAAEKVRKFHPMYGDPEDTTHAKGDDKPLPVELKDRVNKWIEKMQNNPSQFKSKVESSSTLNALIRSEIKNGSI